MHSPFGAARQRPWAWQPHESAQSASLTARQLPPLAVHWPDWMQMSTFWQSASLRATQAPFSSVQAPPKRQMSAFSQCAWVMA